MPRFFSKAQVVGLVACLAFLFGFAVIPVLAQQGVGTLSVTVLDPTGKVVPGASLELLDLDTNSVRKAATTGAGTYSFVGLPIGTYQLTTVKAGFQTEVHSKVIVAAGVTTDLNVPMKIGTSATTVTVTTAAAPLLQTTSTVLATTINMKQLQDLPLNGRDVSQLAFLVAGAVNSGVGQTWNGAPLIAQTNTIDGVVSSSTRMKFAGNATPGLQERLDSISQLTVTTGQMGVSQGYGLGTVSSAGVTQRGTNSYHGKAYEDFRNSWLNANQWFNNADNAIAHAVNSCPAGQNCYPRNRLILNDFGGDFGGPVPLTHHKLFFFGAFGMSKQPGGYRTSAPVLSPEAQLGNMVLTHGLPASQSSGWTHVCLLKTGFQADPSWCPNQSQSLADQLGLSQDTLNSAVAAQQALISGSGAGAATKFGTAIPVVNNPNIDTLSWATSAPVTDYFPTVRVDYNLSSKLRMDVAWEEEKDENLSYFASQFPGPNFSGTGGGIRSNNYTASLGFEWTISPTLINQFHGGYFYNSYWNPCCTTENYLQPGYTWVSWAYGSSGQTQQTPITEYYPVVNFTDGFTWQKSSHTVTFGFGYWREQDHYWNGPGGWLQYNLGLASHDPATVPMNDYFSSINDTTDTGGAEALYGTLIGDVTGVSAAGGGYAYNFKTGKYNTGVGEYPLDELMSSWNLYLNDSWRARPSLTLTYGLSWEFENANHDLTGAYHNANIYNAFGPTAPADIFQAGVLNGVQNPLITTNPHAYPNYSVTPQPRLGLAWNPRSESGFMGKLLGSGDTVIRAGFDIRRFTEPQQYYWDAATNYGFAYYQSGSISGVNPNTFSGATGTFPEGSVYLGQYSQAALQNTYPFALAPTQYQQSYTEASQEWTGYWGGIVNGFTPNIREPYMEEWTLGIQRQLGRSNVLEVRYVGHHTLHEWVDLNPNEVNIFQPTMSIGAPGQPGVSVPGFLSEFQTAQQNLARNNAAGGSYAGSFADFPGVSGDQPLPIFDAAFANEGQQANQPYNAGDYSNGFYTYLLQTGQAGGLAGNIGATYDGPFYLCNLVGSNNLSPCITNVGDTVGTGNFPLNYFQSNPYAGYSGTGVMVDSGYGNYNSLQIELRQNDWHGMQFDANYTYQRSLGIEPNGNWTGSGQYYTLRNMRLSYGPTAFNIRQVLHVSGTYSLPIGTGQRFLNTSNPVLSRIVSGWTVGTIVTYQTGNPSVLYGGTGTFNDIADSGVSMNGLATSALQNAVGVYHVAGADYSLAFNPNSFTPLGGFTTPGAPLGVAGPDGTSITPFATPGQLGQYTYIYGPHFSNTDIAITKFTRIRENLGLTFQGEFLNAFNHPNWGFPNTGIQSGGFGIQGVTNEGGSFPIPGFGRQIQLRAALQF